MLSAFSKIGSVRRLPSLACTTLCVCVLVVVAVKSTALTFHRLAGGCCCRYLTGTEIMGCGVATAAYAGLWSGMAVDSRCTWEHLHLIGGD